MDELDIFGEIRSIVNGAPDEDAWKVLCSLLELEDDDCVREELVPYIEHHLEDWPDELRVAPESWGRVAAAGRDCARLLVARKLDAIGRNDDYDLKALLTSRDVARIEALDLGYNGFDERALDAIEQSEHLGALRWLSVSDSKMGHESLIRIIRSPRLEKLTHLIAAWCEIENDGAVALQGVEELGRLTRIELRGNRIRPPAAQVLLSSPHFGSCLELAVGWNDIADVGVVAIADSAYLGQLQELCLENNSIEGWGVLELLKRPAIRNLEKLRLYNNQSTGLGDEIAVAVATCPYLGNLRVLDLSGNSIGERGRDALARSVTLHEDARGAMLGPSPQEPQDEE